MISCRFEPTKDVHRLSENSIGDAGAQRLARVLAIKNSLDELE